MSDKVNYLADPTHKEPKPAAPKVVDFLELDGDHVLIVRDGAADRTKGGIFLPDAAKEVPRKGEVVAVGPGKPCDFSPHERFPMMYKVGDRVFYQVYGGSMVEFEGVEYWLMRASEIICRIKPVAPGEPEKQVEMDEAEYRKKRNVF